MVEKVNMLKQACLVAFVACVSAQIFGHHDHSEHSSFMFYYDPMSHYLVGRTHSSCYFMSLSDDDVTIVHTTAGLERVEMKMISMIAGNEDQLSTADLVKHKHMIDVMCRSHTLYRVGSVAAPTFTYPQGRTTTPTPKAVPTTTPGTTTTPVVALQ